MLEQKTGNTSWVSGLLEWFQTHRRDLPWRRDFPRDPYKVWVSEIMLQQTKVEAVKPYYDSWMDRFPTLESLAAASEDDVLRQWQGLGYYSRARNLHEAVQEVVASYGGHVPEQKKDVLALKGVGDYTAGAILSIAYGMPEAAVDGNVLRVFARLYNIDGNILSSAVKKQITACVEQCIPRDQAGVFNEALMDFGALVCIPKHPRCGECPLAASCLARKAGREQELPVRITKKKVPVEPVTVVMVEQNRKWLLHRRPPKGLLASMWEFPNAAGSGHEGIQAVQHLLANLGLDIAVDPLPVHTLKHVFSHKIWHMTVYIGHVTDGILTNKEDWQWLPCEDYASVPWAGPHGKLTAL
ncbi:A/G-specific adenine glycosylase [uncultured Megasphaera sp.]|uniref:A/G-specific adenine glycosylase n=1 Tax=uncultured Megasphaera sp. TaxID=165188 RepID=UPI00265B7160|nr:A/G-specific adenine glycosylase [uncultured Megasphaera sp.]